MAALTAGIDASKRLEPVPAVDSKLGLEPPPAVLGLFGELAGEAAAVPRLLTEPPLALR